MLMRYSGTLVWTLFLCLYLFLANAAAARQDMLALPPWAPNYEQPFVSQIDNTAIKLLTEALALSDAQQVALQRMLDEHKERFAAMVAEAKPVKKEFDDAIRELSPSTARWIMLQFEYEERLAKVADQQADLDERFLEQARTLLTDAQAERWSDFRNDWVRLRWAGIRVTYFEEPLDMVAMIESFERDGLLLERDDVLTSLVREYTAQLASRLNARAQFEIEESRNFYRRDRDRYYVDVENDRSWMGAGKGNWRAKFWADRRRRGDTCRHVRDVNRAFRPMIQAALPEALQPLFERIYYDSALRMLTRSASLPAHDFLDAVLARDDLDAGQRAAIEGIRETYRVRFLQRAQAVLRAQEAVADSHFDDVGLDKREARQASLQVAIVKLCASEGQAIDETWPFLNEQQRAQMKRPNAEPPLTR